MLPSGSARAAQGAGALALPLRAPVGSIRSSHAAALPLRRRSGGAPFSRRAAAARVAASPSTARHVAASAGPAGASALVAASAVAETLEEKATLQAAPERSFALGIPPDSSRLQDVLPYLWQVALQDRTLTPKLWGAAISLILAKTLGLSVPLLFKHAVDSLAGAAGGTSLELAAASKAAAIALALAGCARAMAGLAQEARMLAFTPVAQSSARRVALHAFEHVLNLDLAFHVERRTGSLSRVLDRGTRSVAMVFRAVVFTFFPTLVELVAVCALLWHAFSGAVVVLVLATFALYVAWTIVLTGLAASRREEANRLDSASSGRAVDALLNYETVATFGNVGVETNEYNGLLKQFQKAALHAEKASCALNAGQAVILAGGMTAVLVAAALGMGGSTATVGALVMANGLIMQLWAPLNFLGFFYRELRQSLVDIKAMFSVLARPSSVPDGTLPLPPAASASFPGLALELRDVRFSYGNRQVLRGVSLSVAPGESLGVVGESGSGKSTLLRLILRMYDPESGAVLLDGVDARQLRLASLRSAVAVVPQDTVLFNDTLSRNIEYGRPGASQADIAAAAEAAQLRRTLVALPGGLETQVGERGVKLSGGEKQRVALARAFLRAPRLLVSDEATSALDSESEAGILESLRTCGAGRTSVTVAHRLSTVRHCDRIIVLVDGLVVESGGHEELLARGGRYAAMWSRQEADAVPAAALSAAR